MPTTYPVGCNVKGKITNITDFGLFVEVEEGIEGLVHVSRACRQKGKPTAENFQEGQEIMAKVIHVSGDERRLGLSIKAIRDEESRKPKEFPCRPAGSRPEPWRLAESRPGKQRKRRRSQQGIIFQSRSKSRRKPGALAPILLLAKYTILPPAEKALQGFCVLNSRDGFEPLPG